MTRMSIRKRELIVEPGKYQHYKGQFYEVIGIVRHSETLEALVLYRALYENRTSALWVRPVQMFLEQVKVKGKMTPRFKKVSS